MHVSPGEKLSVRVLALWLDVDYFSTAKTKK
jgi:hypothetical protein